MDKDPASGGVGGGPLTVIAVAGEHMLQGW